MVVHPATITIIWSVITLEISLIHGGFTVYPESFILQFAVSPKKTPMQELKWKLIVLILKQNGNMEETRKGWKFDVWVFSYNWQIHVMRTSHSPYMPDNGEFSVVQFGV
jgi:hypothetical protein